MEEMKNNQHNEEFEEEKKNNQDIEEEKDSHDIEEEKDNQEIEEEENVEKIKDAGTVEDRLNKKRMLVISAIATAIGLFVIFSFFSDVIFGMFHRSEIIRREEAKTTLTPGMNKDWKSITDMKISKLQNQIEQLENQNQQLMQTIKQQQKQQQQQQQQQQEQHQENLEKLISHHHRHHISAPPVPPPPPPPPINYNNNSYNNSSGPMTPPMPKPKPKLRVFKAKQTAFKETKGAKAVSATEKVNKTEEIKIPLGFIRGLTLTGLDAPTFQYGQSNPEPILIMSLSRQILADNKRLNLKGCFFLGSGYGEISSERAYIRLVKISCIDRQGHILEQRVHGWVFDADGKVGLRGRVVSKQGAVLAKTFMAGLLQGISSIISSSATTTQISPLGTTQTISPKDITEVAAANGFENAAAELAQFYIKVAEQMYPVVEIKPGRKVTILIDNGNLEKSNKVKLVRNPLE